MTPSSPIALEGAFLVERAVRRGLELEELLCVSARESWALELLSCAGRRSAGAGGRPAIKVLSEAEMAEKAGYPFHRGVYALAKRPKDLSAEGALPAGSGPSTILVLPELSDPENLGAAFRNAAALGCDALLLGPKGPDPLSRRVLRVSMGASLSLPWARLGEPDETESLAGRGYARAACVLDPEAEDLRSWSRPSRLALFLGNEAFGLSEAWLERCEHRITLPMSGGTDSLNLATAAAVFLYALGA